MNILYIVTRPIEINTSSSIRNAATIKGLIENGNTVDVLSAEPDSNHQGYDESLHVSGANYLYKRNGAIQSMVRFSRKMHIPVSLKKIIAGWLSKTMIYDNFVEVANEVDKWNMDINRYDCIISSSDPKSSHLVAYKLKEKARINKIRWIQIWGDPFLGDISANYSKSTKKKIEKEERWLLNGADKIIYVSKMTLEEQKLVYPENQKNMVFLPPPYLRKTVCENLHQDIDKINLAYCGDFNKKIRNIMPLIECVKKFKKVHLVICGDGDAEIGRCENIDRYERLSRTKVIKMEEQADVLVYLCNRKGSQIPGKIYQYAGTNKRILFILDGESEKIKKIFEPYHRFIFCENDTEDIGKALKDIMQGNVKMIMEPVEEFSPYTIAKKILE